MKEIWKDINGYEGVYQVSNFGNVRSLDRIVNGSHNNTCLKKGRILKPRINRDGYYTVVLCVNMKKKYVGIHRLVAETFIPNPENFPCVNHKDENKLNNFVYVNEDGTIDIGKSYLEWCNTDYNNTYGTRLQRAASSKSIPIIQFNLEGKILKEWKSAVEVEKRLGFSKNSIRSCCRGEHKQAYGYIWKYKEGA